MAGFLGGKLREFIERRKKARTPGVMTPGGYSGPGTGGASEERSIAALNNLRNRLIGRFQRRPGQGQF